MTLLIVLLYYNKAFSLIEIVLIPKINRDTKDNRDTRDNRVKRNTTESPEIQGTTPLFYERL